jgi:UDPglucose 6-dehydrogenase
MEICHKKGGNVDNVTNALKMATDRLISPKYLSAGMGDGGGCHPPRQFSSPIS